MFNINQFKKSTPPRHHQPHWAHQALARGWLVNRYLKSVDIQYYFLRLLCSSVTDWRTTHPQCSSNNLIPIFSHRIRLFLKAAASTNSIWCSLDGLILVAVPGDRTNPMIIH